MCTCRWKSRDRRDKTVGSAVTYPLAAVLANALVVDLA